VFLEFLLLLSWYVMGPFSTIEGEGHLFIYLFLLVQGGDIMRGKATCVTKHIGKPLYDYMMFSFSIYVRKMF
jgi:hypothetical protein